MARKSGDSWLHIKGKKMQASLRNLLLWTSLRFTVFDWWMSVLARCRSVDKPVFVCCWQWVGKLFVSSQIILGQEASNSSTVTLALLDCPLHSTKQLFFQMENSNYCLYKCPFLDIRRQRIRKQLFQKLKEWMLQFFTDVLNNASLSGCCQSTISTFSVSFQLW